jgi:hypothetical protein
MTRSGLGFGFGLLSLLAACGAAQEPAAAPASPPPAPVAVASTVSAAVSEPAVAAPAPAPAPPPAATTRDVPATCDTAPDCYPPTAFAEAVCKKKFNDLPLYLFASRLPWRHSYVKAEYVEPVNPYGGEQSEAWMQFGEEVVVLRRRSAGAGKSVQISGPSDVDVLRWDGTCATIREEMLVSYVPAPMQSPRIIWKYLDSGSQEALLKSSVVARSREAEKKNCRDSSVTHPTPTCEKAMRQLTDAIVLAVHQNIELPGTGALPSWSRP